MPTISLITICFNNLPELINTCKSVDQQNLPPFEHVVIDGSTQDEIQRFLNHHPQPPYRKWLCEPDQGISDAFNKGLRLSTGDWIGILNSGDELNDEEAYERLYGLLSTNPPFKWLHGKQLTFRGGHWVAVGKPFVKSKIYKGMRGVFHSTMYLKKELYEVHGGYDLNCKYAMDYDLLCRICDEPHYFLDSVLVKFNPHGISSRNYEIALWEASRIYRKYFGTSCVHLAWMFRLILLNRLLNTKLGKALYRLKLFFRLENK